MGSKTVRIIGRLKNDNRLEHNIAIVGFDEKISNEEIDRVMVDALSEFTTLPGNWIRFERAIYDLSDYDKVRYEIINGD